LFPCNLKSNQFQAQPSKRVGSADCATAWFRFNCSFRVISFLLRCYLHRAWFRFNCSFRVLSSLPRRYLRLVEFRFTRTSRFPFSEDQRYLRRTGLLIRWHTP
jgi:hypothetical protein